MNAPMPNQQFGAAGNRNSGHISDPGRLSQCRFTLGLSVTNKCTWQERMNTPPHVAPHWNPCEPVPRCLTDRNNSRPQEPLCTSFRNASRICTNGCVGQETLSLACLMTQRHRCRNFKGIFWCWCEYKRSQSLKCFANAWQCQRIVPQASRVSPL